jgi:hypothetical protein
MPLKPPAWCANAVPTKRGWEDPQSGEVFVSRKFKQSEIDAWHGKVAPVKEQVVHEEPQMLHEAPVQGSLETMTKVQLEALGREHGIELDRRLKKDTLIDQLQEHID